MTKVLLADPDAPTRAGIRVALEDGGFDVCAEPADAGAALQAALRERPEVCLVDMRLPGGAIDAVEAISDRLPSTKFVLLGDSGEEREVLAAVMAGASGYLDKNMAPKRLLATVRGVLNGEAALSRRTTHLVLEAFRSRERGRRLPSSPGSSRSRAASSRRWSSWRPGCAPRRWPARWPFPRSRCAGTCSPSSRSSAWRIAMPPSQRCANVHTGERQWAVWSIASVRRRIDDPWADGS